MIDRARELVAELVDALRGRKEKAVEGWLASVEDEDPDCPFVDVQEDIAVAAYIRSLEAERVRLWAALEACGRGECLGDTWCMEHEVLSTSHHPSCPMLSPWRDKYRALRAELDAAYEERDRLREHVCECTECNWYLREGDRCPHTLGAPARDPARHERIDLESAVRRGEAVREWLAGDDTTPPEPGEHPDDVEARRLRDEVEEATRGMEGVPGAIRAQGPGEEDDR